MQKKDEAVLRSKTALASDSDVNEPTTAEDFEVFCAEIRNAASDCAARLIRAGVVPDEAMRRANKYIYDEMKEIIMNHLVRAGRLK